MRARRTKILTLGSILTIGSALLLTGTPAEASTISTAVRATPVRAVLVQPLASWHVYNWYGTQAECEAVGAVGWALNQWDTYACVAFTIDITVWFLYVYN